MVTGQADDTDLGQDENEDGREGSTHQAGPARSRGHPFPEHAENERREQRGVEEAEQRLQVVHQVGVARRDQRGEDGEDRGRDSGDPPNQDVVAVGPVLDHVVLPDVVAEHGVERRDVGRHARHEGGEQTGDGDTQQAVGQDVADHQQHRVVVGDVAFACRLQPDHVTDRRGGDHAGHDNDEGNEHLRERADDRGAPRRGDGIRGHRALYLDEVGRPVAE